MAATGSPRSASLLGLRGFRRLLLVRLVGQFGDGLLQVGLTSFVFFSPERAATPARIAAGFAVLLLPFCLVGPFAGVLLDRWSRQRILLVTNLVRAGASSASPPWLRRVVKTSASTSWRLPSWASTGSSWQG